MVILYTIEKYYRKIVENKYKYVENVYKVNDSLVVQIAERNTIEDFNFYNNNLKINDSIFNNLNRCTAILLQQKVKPKQPISILFDKFYKSPTNNYFAYKQLQALETNYRTQQEKNSYLQTILTLLSFSNDKKLIDSTHEKWKKLLNSKTEELQLKSIDTLFSAVNSNLVMINESHHLPEGRVFLSKNLETFAKLGFTYLAVEALQNDSIQYRKYPMKGDGIYINEPNFGNLLREAIRLNYKIISYDNSIHKNRDSVACKTIYEKTFGTDKNAKVLVFVGYEHINENTSLKKTWLAANFKKYYTINPFTINQTSAIFHKKPTVDNQKLYTIMNPKERIISDVYLYNPIDYTNCYNCNDTLQQCDFLYTVEKFEKDKEIGLIIYYKEEYDKDNEVIPTQVIVSKSQKQVLHLCKGIYIVKEQNQLGKIINEKTIEAK